MEIHHGKHHKAYVDNLNKALDGQPDLQTKPIEQLLRDIDKRAGGRSARRSSTTAAATPTTRCSGRSWAPAAAASRPGQLADAIKATFGDFAKFKAKIKEAGLGRSAAAGRWLVLDTSGKLRGLSTANQDSPLMKRPDAASSASTCGSTPTT